MRKHIKIIAMGVLILFTTSSCSKSKKGSEPEAEKGYAIGKVTDLQGKPISGVEILLENSVLYASYIKGSTKVDGTYKIKIQPGAWYAHAYLKRSYNGKTYKLELHTDNAESFNEDGTVANFVWKLEGRIPRNDYGYYGGFIQLSSDIGFYDDFEDIELTLTPSGPLIDGSAGKTLKLRLGDHYWVDRYQIEDVPIGRYSLKATSNKDNKERPLKIQDWYTKSEFVSEFQLDFIPTPSTGINNSNSIVIGY